jgi:HTH-type transcriptional regulator, sugar sensing transcriptional regulator
MELEKLLMQLGLEEKEAKIYLACLHLGKASVFHIAKESQLKRTTAYFVLNNLNIKGLINISKTKKSALYQAVSPKELLRQIEFRKKNLEENLPELMNVYKDHPDKPEVKILEGEAGLEQIYREAIEVSLKGKEILIYGKVDHFEKEYKKIFELWRKEIKEKKCSAREIIEDSQFAREYARRLSNVRNKKHNIKLTKSSIFKCDNVIFDDKLAIISIGKNTFVTVIKSKDIVETYRNVFDLMWKII